MFFFFYFDIFTFFVSFPIIPNELEQQQYQKSIMTRAESPYTALALNKMQQSTIIRARKSSQCNSYCTQNNKKQKTRNKKQIHTSDEILAERTTQTPNKPNLTPPPNQRQTPPQSRTNPHSPNTPSYSASLPPPSPTPSFPPLPHL